MSFKQFIASLTELQIMAFASQHGFREWRSQGRESLISYLQKSESAKKMFRRIYG